MSGAIQRFLPTLQDSRGIGGIQFGPNAPIRGSWQSNNGLAFTVHRDPSDDFPYYWRAVAYDTFTNYGWQWTGGDDTIRVPRAADDDLLADSIDHFAEPGTKDLNFTVTPDEYRGSYVAEPAVAADDQPRGQPARRG